VSDYLWDKSGSDPEVERLETALAPLAYSGAVPKLPRRRSPIGAWVAAGLAAAALLSLVIWPPWAPRAVAWSSGHAVASGQWLEGPAELQLGALGSVQLGPSTRARMLGEGRMELDHGTLTARISAAPRRFSIDTRYARLIDLGCAFTLTVDAAGSGEVVVTEGSVALARDGREVVVPLGLHCSFTAAGIAGPVAMPTEAPRHVEENDTVMVTAPPKKPVKNIAAPQKNAPQKTPPAQKEPPPKASLQKTPPATPTQKAAPQKEPQKTDPGLKLHHDSLRDLERSAQ
jgi:hypothetical protein